MTIEAIIREKIKVQNFQFPLRTMTKLVMEETRIVKTVAQDVMIREFPNTVQNFIFFIASGKFFSVKPWAPTRARWTVVSTPHRLSPDLRGRPGAGEAFPELALRHPQSRDQVVTNQVLGLLVE